MKNNKKEMLKEANEVPTTQLGTLKLKLKKITGKVSSIKEVHVAMTGIMLVSLMCFSFTSLVAIQVKAQEAEQILTPQTIILQPAVVVEEIPEPDTDGDGYLDINDSCPDVNPTIDDGTGCEEPDTDGDGYTDINDSCPDVYPTVDDGTGCEVVVEVTPVAEEVVETNVGYPYVDYSRNLVHGSGTDMSYMAVDISYNATYYSNGYYCGSDNVAYEEGTDAVLVAMGSQYEYGQYYEVEISNYGTVMVKKVEEKGTTLNNEGFVGPTNDSIELMVCDGFDPNGVGKSSNLGMYINSIYKASY